MNLLEQTIESRLPLLVRGSDALQQIMECTRNKLLRGAVQSCSRLLEPFPVLVFYCDTQHLHVCDYTRAKESTWSRQVQFPSAS